jgi:hypothetical protein
LELEEEEEEEEEEDEDEILVPEEFEVSWIGFGFGLEETTIGWRCELFRRPRYEDEVAAEVASRFDMGSECTEDGHSGREKGRESLFDQSGAAAATAIDNNNKSCAAPSVAGLGHAARMYRFPEVQRLEHACAGTCSIHGRPFQRLVSDGGFVVTGRASIGGMERYAPSHCENACRSAPCMQSQTRKFLFCGGGSKQRRRA